MFDYYVKKTRLKLRRYSLAAEESDPTPQVTLADFTHERSQIGALRPARDRKSVVDLGG
jgi:hypothetical protein